MKFAILGDLHFGVKNNSPWILNYQLTYLETKFIPKLLEEGIKTIVFMGDLLDSRRSVNFLTFHQLKIRFLDVLTKHDIKLLCITGNHDLYYTDSSEVSSYNTVLSEFDCIEVIRDPLLVKLDDAMVAMVPWFSTDEEKAKALTFIETCGTEYIFGHFEIRNFEVVKGIPFDSGLEAETFKNFKQVFSGHFHLKQQTNNILYVGTPWQSTWADYGSHKGFYICDSEDILGTLTYHENIDAIYLKEIYSDETAPALNQKLDFNFFKNKIIQVDVAPVINEVHFSEFLKRMDESGAIQYAINEAPKESVEIENTGDNQGIRDILDSYVSKKYETDPAEKVYMSKLMNDIYVKATKI